MLCQLLHVNFVVSEEIPISLVRKMTWKLLSQPGKCCGIGLFLICLKRLQHPGKYQEGQFTLRHLQFTPNLEYERQCLLRIDGLPPKIRIENLVPLDLRLAGLWSRLPLQVLLPFPAVPPL